MHTRKLPLWAHITIGLALFALLVQIYYVMTIWAAIKLLQHTWDSAKPSTPPAASRPYGP